MQINRKTQKTILWGLLFVLIAVSLFSPVFIRERVNYMDIYSQSPGDIDSYRYYVPNENNCGPGGVLSLAYGE